MRTRPDTVPRRIKRPGMFAGGDGSTLSLDFTTMSSLDSRFTFSRSSPATFINSSGLVQYADHNLMLQSETLNTSPWSVQNGATVTSASVTNPVGGSVSWLVQNGGASSALLQGVTLTAGLRYVLRFWVRAGSSTQLGFGIYSGSFITSTPSIVSGPGSVTGTTLCTVTGLTSGWTQIQLVTNAITTTGSHSILFYPDTSSGTSGNNNYLWGVQINTGTTSLSYQSTTTTAFQAPRFDYDPSTLAPRGLLIEGSATNLLTYSEDYSQAAWTKTTVDRTTGQASPDNGTGATLLSENATTYAKHSLERSQSITAGVHTFSVWVKEPSSNSRRYVCLQLADGQATAARYTIVADLQTGQIAASGSTNGTAGAPTNTGHSITPYPNGWYRLTISMNHVASPSYPAVMLSDISTLFGGNNQPFYSASTPYKGLIVWGAQLEASSAASSYIPTGASTVQRAADSCHITPLTPWFNATEGTVLHESAVLFPASGFTRVYGLVQQTSTPLGVNPDSISLGLQGSTGQLFLNVRDTSTDRVNLFVPLGGAITSGTFHKLAVCYKRGDYRISRAGFSATDAYSTTFPSGLQSLGFNNISANWPAVWFKSVKYFPTRLPNAQMDAWSA